MESQLRSKIPEATKAARAQQQPEFLGSTRGGHAAVGLHANKQGLGMAF